MKRIIIIAIVFMLSAASASAQNLPAKMRMEVTEIEQNDDVYSIFRYTDDDAADAECYLGLRTVLGGFEFSFDGFSGGISDFDETCLSMGGSLTDAISFMDTLLDLVDQQPGTSIELASRPVVFLEGLGDYTTTSCTVVKTLFGKRLEFVFEGRGGRTSVIQLTKGNLKTLCSGLKFHKKLHPED